MLAESLLLADGLTRWQHLRNEASGQPRYRLTQAHWPESLGTRMRKGQSG